MIINHPLRELFHVGRRSVLDAQLPQFDFSHSADSRFTHECAVRSHCGLCCLGIRWLLGRGGGRRLCRAGLQL